MSDEETRAAQFRADHTQLARDLWNRRYHDHPGVQAEADLVLADYQPWITPVRDWDPPNEYDETVVKEPSPFGPRARGQGLEIP